MKKIMFMIISTLFLLSCNNNNIINNPEEPLTTENMLWLTVIKFTKPEYKENILATDEHMYYSFPKDDSVFYACALPEPKRKKYCDWFEKNNLVGTSPYIELIDDYLLIDWHWLYFFAHLEDKVNANFGLTILTELKWADIKTLDDEWERNIPNDHNAIDTIYHFKVRALDDYRGDYSYKTIGWYNHIWFYTLYTFAENTCYVPKDFDNSKIDSLQSIYTDCLIKILKEYRYTDDSYIYEYDINK